MKKILSMWTNKDVEASADSLSSTVKRQPSIFQTASSAEKKQFEHRFTSDCFGEVGVVHGVCLCICVFCGVCGVVT